jgi:hypothetical protein
MITPEIVVTQLSGLRTQNVITRVCCVNGSVIITEHIVVVHIAKQVDGGQVPHHDPRVLLTGEKGNVGFKPDQ